MKHYRLSNTRLAVALGVMIFATAASAKEVHGEYQRKRDNSARILKLNPYMRPKVAAIVSDLEAHGYKPSVDPAVWRTPAQQAAKLKKGYSAVSYSYHNATTPEGKPDSLAADIVDIRWQWDPPGNTYWLKLASSAESHNLTTGIYWKLSDTNRKRIRAAIASKDWDAKIVRGQDAAHVEPKGITLAQARKGIRPK
jgi:hypothetical protein